MRNHVYICIYIYRHLTFRNKKEKTVRKQFGATFEFVAKAKSLSLHLMKIQKVSYLR